MFKANDGDAIPVVRRVGGLEDAARGDIPPSLVVRRVGGLRKPPLTRGLSSFYDFTVFDNEIPQSEP